jgi:hypothetical protein
MTPEQQRIKIAEACCWSACQYCWHPRDTEGRRGKLWLGISPINRDKPFEVACWELPDYLNDLNAMHEAEEILKQKGDFTSYLSALAKTCGFKAQGSEAWFCLHAGLEAVASATAAQRAEAFLRTLNLWES